MHPLSKQSPYKTMPMITMEIERYAYIPLSIYYRFILRNQKFSFNHNEYKYFIHPYNKTWANERAVEIPLIIQLLKSYHPNEVLEVGNVLSHYIPVHHTIIDKYEKRKKVINQDIVSIQENKKYKFIFSISTLEHVGWDETPRQSGKHREALKKITSLLSPGGKMLITFPLGYNTEIDQDCFENNLPGNVTYMLRTSYTTWQQTVKSKVENIRYGIPYKAANALAILVFDKIN